MSAKFAVNPEYNGTADLPHRVEIADAQKKVAALSKRLRALAVIAPLAREAILTATRTDEDEDIRLANTLNETVFLLKSQLKYTVSNVCDAVVEVTK